MSSKNGGSQYGTSQVKKPESAWKRKSVENAEDVVPPKKAATGFNIKSSTSALKSTSKTKPLLKPGAMRKPIHNPVALKLAKDKPKADNIVTKKSSKVAAIFNEDSDSEPEEIPPEAKMRMRNIGRETPTSAGPNSFNKGKLGFCDAQRMWEKRQEQIAKKNQRK